MAQMMEWNNKWKADAEAQKRNEDQYFADCAWENERRRWEKEDALAEYFWQLNNQQDQKYKDYLNNVTVPENMKLAERLMREERERQEKIKLNDRDMAERAERAAWVNDGFVETNKMLQEKQWFDL